MKKPERIERLERVEKREENLKTIQNILKKLREERERKLKEEKDNKKTCRKAEKEREIKKKWELMKWATGYIAINQEEWQRERTATDWNADGLCQKFMACNGYKKNREFGNVVELLN